MRPALRLVLWLRQLLVLLDKCVCFMLAQLLPLIRLERLKGLQRLEFLMLLLLLVLLLLVLLLLLLLLHHAVAVVAAASQGGRQASGPLSLVAGCYHNT
jgi:hypothetical protein